ncbi:MAG: hypothetical protein R6V10_09530 [bacterium]
MDENGELYEGRTHSFELRAFWYELPYFVAALAAGGAVGAAYALVVIYFRDRFEPIVALYVLMGLLLCGLLFVFWSASYYPVRVKVFPDRLWFKMMFGKRVLYRDEVLNIKSLSEEDACRTLMSTRYRSLSPAVYGAVLLERKKGRPWVINLSDRESFLKAADKFEKDVAEEVSKGSA